MSIHNICFLGEIGKIPIFFWLKRKKEVPYLEPWTHLVLGRDSGTKLVITDFLIESSFRAVSSLSELLSILSVLIRFKVDDLITLLIVV